MEQYFGLLLESQYKCTESVEEPASTESEMNFQLSCFISQDVRYMHTGLMKVAPPPPPLSLSFSSVHCQGLEGSVEKYSTSLSRNADYSKTSRISRLPAYLAVQFVRFFVGKAPDSDEIVPKKILKVSFWVM